MAAGHYQRWSVWLDRFERGIDLDMAELPAMRGEELGGPTSARFGQRCNQALNRRLTLWAERYSRDVQAARSADQQRIVLKDARAQLMPLRRFAESDLLIPEVQTALSQLLRSAVDSFQQSLDQDAHTATGPLREQLVAIVRELRLATIFEAHSASVSSVYALDAVGDLTRPAGVRRIIL